MVSNARKYNHKIYFISKTKSTIFIMGGKNKAKKPNAAPAEEAKQEAAPAQPKTEVKQAPAPVQVDAAATAGWGSVKEGD